MDYSNHFVGIYDFSDCSFLYAEGTVECKIFIRDRKYIYRYWIFWVVWNGTDPSILCFAAISVCRNFVFIGILLLLYLFYPVVSMLLGNSFPQMVTYIMPCPVISLSIAVYAGYNRKNKLLLVLLTVWGLTGIKSIIFQAYEDVILLVCGLYGIALLISEIKQPRAKQ